MTSYPYWVTAAVLPSRLEGYSYSSVPEILVYGETTNLPCTVSIPPINGSLPPGTRVELVGGQVQILGQISGVQGEQTYDFTLRLSNGSLVTDRTFSITATNIVDILEWETPNTTPLGYYYLPGPAQYQIRASNTPPKSIFYSFGPYIGWTQGLSIESGTGLVTLDLSWKPTNFYSTTDYVLNSGYLYKCTVPGDSGFARGPYLTGSNVVDSTYPAWTANSYYTLNTKVTNNIGKIYICIVAGFSGATGPTGTGSFIVDGFPTVWSYIGQAAVWNQVTPGVDEQITFTATAQNDEVAPTQTVTRVFSVTATATPHAPIWQTPAGLLATVSPAQNFSFQLEIFDPDLQSITFTCLDLPSWLNLGELGLLWGSVPNVTGNVSYVFTVTASDGVQTVSRTFSILSQKSGQQVLWQSPDVLGDIYDGEFCSIQLQATTTRETGGVTYGLRGGSIPPNTIVVSATGMISGFVEYHPSDKTYFFEVAASDGAETVTKKFQLIVKSQKLEKFLSVTIPITGTEKLGFIANNSTSLCPPEYLFREQDSNWARNNQPGISVITGIKYSNAEQVKNNLSNWLTEFVLQFGRVDVSYEPSLPYQTMFVTVQDSSSVAPWQPYTEYHPTSRVSTSSGLELVATTTGVSGGYPEPKGSGMDGSVVWQAVSVPNTASNRTLPLPWYPAHLYQQYQTVLNEGSSYTADNLGRSSGGFGPQGVAPVPDGEITWRDPVTGDPLPPNTFYPPSIYNLRTELKTRYGYSNAKGSGAIGFANVNLATSGISSITVADPGEGYLSQPPVIIRGDGTGATGECVLSILTATIVSSSPGFQVGMEFPVSQGQIFSVPGRIRVESTNPVGIVTGISIIESGGYTQFPQGNVAFVVGAANLLVQFNLGIGQVRITSAGAGYSTNTVVSFAGTELLPNWQQSWSKGYVLSIPLAAVTQQGADYVKNRAFQTNPYQGQSIEVKQVEIRVQGLIWEGDTSFDGTSMSWDTNATRLVEFDPASETDFDHSSTIFDRDNTWFDHGMLGNFPFSNTVFDTEKTIFDYYATLFDERASITSSRFSRSWLIDFGKPWQ
jgi:hypothetical protein